MTIKYIHTKNISDEKPDSSNYIYQSMNSTSDKVCVRNGMCFISMYMVN